MRNLRSQEQIMASWKGDVAKPVVSICCLTYNHEPYVEDAIEGFLTQETDFPIEILIHDDASTDNTACIIREYESKYPKLIKPIYQVKNQFSQKKRSLNAEFNYTRARGDFLAICEGDDYWISPEKLSKQVTALSKSIDSSISFHPVKVLSDRKISKSFGKGYGFYGDSTQTFSGDKIIRQAGPGMAMCSIMVRKSVVERLLEKSPDFFYTKMTHFFLQSIALIQGQACYIPDCMSAYRYGHEGSWSDKCSQDNVYRFNQIKKFIESLDELLLLFPNEHVRAFSSARQKKIRQASRLPKIPIGDKLSLYKASGDKTLEGMGNFIIGIVLSWAIRARNICRFILRSFKT